MRLPYHPSHRSSSSVSSHQRPPEMEFWHHEHFFKTRSSWINCALRYDEAVYWISIGHYEGEAVGSWLYWLSRGHSCLYILQKVEIWTGVTDAWLTHSLTSLKDRATQLLLKYKSGALVTQYCSQDSTIAVGNGLLLGRPQSTRYSGSFPLRGYPNKGWNRRFWNKNTCFLAKIFLSQIGGYPHPPP